MPEQQHATSGSAPVSLPLLDCREPAVSVGHDRLGFKISTACSSPTRQWRNTPLRVPRSHAGAANLHSLNRPTKISPFQRPDVLHSITILVKNPGVRQDLFSRARCGALSRSGGTAQAAALCGRPIWSGRYFEDVNRRQVYCLILMKTVTWSMFTCCIVTWRDLLSSQHTTAVWQLSNIDVVVLPHCYTCYIDRLEAQLQVEKDIRPDYSWTRWQWINVSTRSAIGC